MSPDGTNRLTCARVLALTVAMEELKERKEQRSPLIIAGNRHFFSVGADLNEIAALTSPARREGERFRASGKDSRRSIVSSAGV